VVDSSFFVSSTSVNPTLTIIANALRVAEHIGERMGVKVDSAFEQPLVPERRRPVGDVPVG
jgi:choline dehydrogenase-like flavoprotein